MSDPQTCRTHALFSNAVAYMHLAEVTLEHAYRIAPMHGPHRARIHAARTKLADLTTDLMVTELKLRHEQWDQPELGTKGD